MNEEKINHNTEDTGKTKAQAKRGGRGKRIALIVIAVAAVAAIAIAGWNMIGSKSYNDQLALAEKALAEGDYEAAEADYLKAVGMNPRDTRGRAGLAYTHAAMGKTEEAVTEYEELYKQTGDEAYKAAADAVANGNLPEDVTALPIPDEYAKLTKEAFSKYAGTYYYDLAGGDYWPFEDDYFELNPGRSYVKLDVSESGAFKVQANQYEEYTDIHSAAYDEIVSATAEGFFVCTGKNSDGSYNLKLMCLASTSKSGEDFDNYYDPTDGNTYELPFTYKEYNRSHGFKNAGSFVLSDRGLENTGGGQIFTRR